MKFLGKIFGAKASESILYRSMTLDQLVTDTAYGVAAHEAAQTSTSHTLKAKSGRAFAQADFSSGLDDPQNVVKQIHAAALARVDGQAVSGVILEEAIDKVCSGMRESYGLSKVYNVQYQPGDAEGAGISVRGLENIPTPQPSLAQKILAHIGV